MERFARAYVDLARRSRVLLQVSATDSERRFSVELLGVMTAGRNLLISAPATPDKSLIAVRQGQVLTCRWLSASNLYHFGAAITNLAFEPQPVVYLGQLHGIQRRALRSLPRARAALNAVIRSPATHAALVTDMSLGGAQIGATSDLQLGIGQIVELAIRPRLFDRDFVVTLKCTVVSTLGAADADHPNIHFYGLTFIEPTETDLLVLHGFVQERLAQEADRLSQMLVLLGEADAPAPAH